MYHTDGKGVPHVSLEAVENIFLLSRSFAILFIEAGEPLYQRGADLRVCGLPRPFRKRRQPVLFALRSRAD
jgi:hypothetical protein